MRGTADKRIPELEGVRGILSLLVVSGHVCPAPIFWFPGCMEFFFVISGYLITRILLNAPRVDGGFLKVYFIRRALRIWPMYYIALAIYVGLCGWVVPRLGFPVAGADASWTPSWQPVAMSAVFLQYTDASVASDFARYPSLFHHSWSVAVEEQYYFLWPLVFLLVTKASRGFGVLACLLAISTATLLRCAAHIEYDSEAFMTLLPSRLDSFALGISLAFLFARREHSGHDGLRRSLWIAAASGAAMLAPYLLRGYGVGVPELPALLSWTLFYPTLGFAMLAFGVIGSVILNSGNPSLRWLRLPWLMHVGAISYSTYLLHVLALVLVATWLQNQGIQHVVLQWMLTVSLTLGIAHLTYTYIEMKALALKKHLQYRPNAGASEGASEGVPEARDAMPETGTIR